MQAGQLQRHGECNCGLCTAPWKASKLVTLRQAVAVAAGCHLLHPPAGLRLAVMAVRPSTAEAGVGLNTALFSLHPAAAAGRTAATARRKPRRYSSSAASDRRTAMCRAPLQAEQLSVAGMGMHMAVPLRQQRRWRGVTPMSKGHRCCCRSALELPDATPC